ncbi:MAG: TolC family protein [Chitinophagaceae bacterium]
MNKWSLGILLLLLISSNEVLAQKVYSLSAKQAADLALQNVTEIKNLQIDREMQISKNREYIAQAFPQISGSISTQHFFSIPVTLLPDFISPSVYQVLVDNGVRNGAGAPIVKPGGPPEFFPAQFGVPWQSSAGFTFQQLLFQPDLFIAIAARKKAVDFTEANLRVMEDSVKSNIYRSYYSVKIAEKRKQYLDESIVRLQKLKSDQEKLFKNGFAERLDIDKTQVSLNNLKSTTNQIEKLIEIGYASLKFAMAIEQKDSLILTDSLSEDQVKKDLLELTNFQYTDRNEIQLLGVVKELQGLDLKRQKLTYMPTIATYWNYSRNALGQEFNLFNFENKWFKASVWGVNMSIPIFDAGQKGERIRQAKMSLQKTKNTEENLKRAIDLQINASSIIFKNARSTLDMQDQNLELAQRVYNSTMKKYEQGLGSSFELLQTETDLENAEANFFQALYDAINAKIAYTKALGKL